MWIRWSFESPKLEYLPQAAMVERLLNLINEILPKIPDDNYKHSLTGALNEFEKAITLSAIYLEEVFEYAALQDIQLTNEQAIEILENAALDIDSNYTSQAVEYHADQFIQEIDGGIRA